MMMDGWIDIRIIGTFDTLSNAYLLRSVAIYYKIDEATYNIFNIEVANLAFPRESLVRRQRT